MSTVQILFLLGELVVVLGVIVYLHSVTFSLLRGAPFVPTKSADIDDILQKANLRPGMKFLELGCGDGRVVCQAVKQFGVVGRGVDVSRLWLGFARIRARRLGIDKDVEFIHENIIQTDVAWADVIYLYMMPRFLEKHAQSIFAKCRPGTVVISYVFEIACLTGHSKQTTTNMTPSFVYKISEPLT